MRAEGETESAYIKRSFEEAMDPEMLDEVDDQLRAEGLKSDNVRPYKSKRRKEFLRQGKATTTTAMVRSSAQLTPEAIVDSLEYPVSADGEVNPAFVAGMKYEAKNIIRGIRIAQELNRMGLEQAKPVIEMAKEMRQAEGQAAQVIAEKLAQATMQSNQQILGAIQEVTAPQPAGTNPMAQAFANAAAPLWGQMLQRLFSSLTGLGGRQPAQQPVQGPVAVNPHQQVQPKPEGPPPHLRPGEEVNEWTEA